MIEAIFPIHWKGEYELIDSGSGMKLEKFGHHILARPEPQAIWNARLSKAEWEGMQTGAFARSSANVQAQVPTQAAANDQIKAG